jgi:hypothetical protein
VCSGPDDRLAGAGSVVFILDVVWFIHTLEDNMRALRWPDRGIAEDLQTALRRGNILAEHYPAFDTGGDLDSRLLDLPD